MSFKRFLLILAVILSVFVVIYPLVRFRGLPGQPAPTPSFTAVVILPRLAVADIPPNLPDYDRDDWRHWIDVDADCQNTRHEVLIAESLQPVTFTDARQCTVAGGLWASPYDGARLTDPGELDIDHVVPLGNAHRSGGWAWDAARKQSYANSLGHPDHLIAVTAAANRAKGDKGPDAWRPPDRNNWCDYAIDWITIKAAWSLSATPAEWSALREMLAVCTTTVHMGDNVLPKFSPVSSPAPATPGSLLYDTAGTDRDCGDFPTWQRAQSFYTAAGGPQRDPHRLDPDTDGIACETLPGAP